MDTAGTVSRSHDAALPDETVYSITQALPLGRTAYHADTRTLWCAHSGSGAAFGFRGESCILTLAADSAYTRGADGAAHYAVLRNGETVAEGLLTEPERTVEIGFEAGENGFAWVRLVKLSEAAFSSMGVKDIMVRAGALQENRLIPAERKPRLIEFIGDSITCGYGVDGKCGDLFSTENENAARAYSWLTAESLGADSSMVCFSGYGVLSGYTALGNCNRQCLVPPYYAKVGYSAAVIEERRRIQDEEWDFSVQPDAVVINLGTNDASYTGNIPEMTVLFSDAYQAFLHTVREKNSDAVIVCTLGIMGLTLCDAVEQAVQRYQAETGDVRICTMRFDEQKESDGMGVDYHPSAVTHAKAAEKLTAFLRARLGWE